MCTVTVVPRVDGFRLMCNRDERRDRAAALPPAARRLEHRAALFPLDPVGGGTWVGVNDAGLVAVLLNRTTPNAVPRRRPPVRSRGLIVPRLLDCASVSQALESAERLNPIDFDLFRLVLVQPMAAAILTSDGRALSLDTLDLSRPFMRASSSLGDGMVEGPRRRLFDRMMAEGLDSRLQAQTRFHDHSWPLHPHASVRMSRRDARTVSRTRVDVTSKTIALEYEALADVEGASGAARPEPDIPSPASSPEIHGIALRHPALEASL